MRILHGHVFALFLIPALAVSAALSTAQETRLRQLLRMPRLSGASIGVGFSFKDGVLVQGWRDRRAEADRVREAIRKDSSNPELYEQLAAVYRKTDDTNSTAASDKAVALYRVRGADRSKDAAMLARFGRALMNAGENGEAETVLRKALKADPKHWQAWSTLAIVLGERALTNIHGSATYEIDSLDRAIAAARANRFKDAAVQATRQQFARAVQASDRALSLGPREAQAYVDRLAVDTMGAYLDALLKLTQGAEWDASRVQGEMFLSTNIVNALWRVVELMPDDPESLLVAAMFAFSSSSLRDQQSVSDKGKPDRPLWERMPRDTQERIRQGIKRLETQAQGANTRGALTGLEVCGFLQYLVFDDKSTSEVTLRRVLARDPRRDFAWSFLMAIAFEDRRILTALEYCQSRLEARDDLVVRVALSKVCVELNRLDEAQAHAEAALRFDPNGFESNLAAAVVTLKRSVSRESLSKAATHFNTFTDAPGFPATSGQGAQYAYNAAILALLADQPEAARIMIQKALKLEPDDESAKEVLACIPEK